MNRYRFVLHRPLQLVAVAFGISIVTFVLAHLIPGDPARTMLGTRATPTAIANIRAEYGLDEPLVAAVRPVPEASRARRAGRVDRVQDRRQLRSSAPASSRRCALVTGSVVLSLLIALPLAAIARPAARSPGDHAVRVVSMLGMGPPAVPAGADADHRAAACGSASLPVSGYGRARAAKLAHLVLPCLTVAVPLAALLTRNLRASLVAGAGVGRGDRRPRARHAGERRVLAARDAQLARTDHQPDRPQRRLAAGRHGGRRERVRGSRNRAVAGPGNLRAATTWWCRASRWCSPAGTCWSTSWPTC